MTPCSLKCLRPSPSLLFIAFAIISFGSGCTKEHPPSSPISVKEFQEPSPLADYSPAKVRSQLDLWTRGLTQKRVGQLPTNIAEIIQNSFKRATSTAGDFWSARFIELLSDQLSGAYPTEQEYDELASALYDARDLLRASRPVQHARTAAHLLAALVDEALYVKQTRFQSRSFEWKWQRPVASKSCSGNYNGVDICEADIFLSKSTEFSSLIFQFRFPEASTFSHTALVSRTSEKDITFVEASQNGRKVFSPTSVSALPRTSIYRYKGDSKRLSSFQKRLSSFGAFKFNYTLETSCAPGKYFCSELAHCSYKSLGLIGMDNPYPDELWSQSKQSEGSKIFTLGIGLPGVERIPLPGDVELNPNYEAVAHFIRTPNLSELRMRQAIMEAIVQVTGENIELRTKYLETAQKVAKSPTIQRMLLGRIPASSPYRVDLEQLKKELSSQVSPQLLVFYVHMHSIVVPETLAEMKSEFGSRVVLPSELFTAARVRVEQKLWAFSRI